MEGMSAFEPVAVTSCGMLNSNRKILEAPSNPSAEIVSTGVETVRMI